MNISEIKQLKIGDPIYISGTIRSNYYEEPRPPHIEKKIEKKIEMDEELITKKKYFFIGYRYLYEGTVIKGNFDPENYWPTYLKVTKSIFIVLATDSPKKSPIKTLPELCSLYQQKEELK